MKAILYRDDFVRLLDKQESNHMRYPNSTQTEYGVGIYAMEHEDKDYIFVYYGDYREGVRDGSGSWIYFLEKDAGWNIAKGKWKNALPNGYFSENIVKPLATVSETNDEAT